MKATTLSKAITALVVVYGCVTSGLAQISLSVDMDLGTLGIQSTRVAAPGDIFTVGLVLDVGAGGVSSYGVSVKFDTTTLSLNGSPAAAVPALPSGLISLAAPSENNAPGQLYSFNGATLGAGPASTSFLIGSVSFRLLASTNSGSPSLTVGFFNTGVDGLFDNAGNPITPVFQPGVVLASPPRISVLRTSANGVLVSWSTNSPGFVLQQNSALGTTNWTPVTDPPIEVGENWQVLISPLVGQGFYRLFKR